VKEVVIRKTIILLLPRAEKTRRRTTEESATTAPKTATLTTGIMIAAGIMTHEVVDAVVVPLPLLHLTVYPSPTTIGT
jgi:hypothetical protein